MRSPLNSRGIALLAVAVGWALFLTIIGSPQVILFTVPVFMLCAPLALGRYVGEELIVGLSRRRAPRRRGLAPAKPAYARPSADVRGAPLLASNLAGRAPPLAST